MSTVRFDHLPAEMTDGEREALRAATIGGWINPPIVCAWKAEPPRTWRSVHIRYLERRGLVRLRLYRPDNLPRVQLNAAGMAARAAVLS